MAATVLFAAKGYSAVSMRDIAEEVGIQAASLYNHFPSKEELWREVLTHAKELYLLFFQHMEKRVSEAATFAEVLQVIFEEPEKMNNQFTCFAFALIQAEQFRDEYAAEVYHNFLLKYAVDFVKKQFDECIERGLVSEFDTWTVANMYSHNVLVGINLSVQKLLGRPIPYDPGKVIGNLHRYILDMLSQTD